MKCYLPNSQPAMVAFTVLPHLCCQNAKNTEMYVTLSTEAVRDRIFIIRNLWEAFSIYKSLRKTKLSIIIVAKQVS